MKSQSPSPGEIAGIVRARSEVLETINRWLHDGGGAQDALDDPQLHAAVTAFFRHPTDHLPPSVNSEDTAAIRHGYALVRDNLTAVYSSYTAQTQRPSVRLIPYLEASSESSASGFSTQPLDVDQMDPMELVDSLDVMAMAAFHNVTQEVSPAMIIGKVSHLSASNRTSSSQQIYWKCRPPTVSAGSPFANPTPSLMRWKSSPFIHTCTTLNRHP